MLVESANQFSLEELCRTQYSLKYFFRSHVDHQTYGKTLTCKTCEHAGHTRKASQISKAVVDNCGKGVDNFYLLICNVSSL